MRTFSSLFIGVLSQLRNQLQQVKPDGPAWKGNTDDPIGPTPVQHLFIITNCLFLFQLKINQCLKLLKISQILQRYEVQVNKNFSKREKSFIQFLTRLEKRLKTFVINIRLWAVAVAQLVERSLPIPEVRGSNPVIAKFIDHLFNVNWIEKIKIKKKEAGNGSFFIKKHLTSEEYEECMKATIYVERIICLLWYSNSWHYVSGATALSANTGIIQFCAIIWIVRVNLVVVNFYQLQVCQKFTEYVLAKHFLLLGKWRRIKNWIFISWAKITSILCVCAGKKKTINLCNKYFSNFYVVATTQSFWKRRTS